MVNGSSLTQQNEEHADVQPGLVKSVGCVFCWRRHYRPFTRACRGPNPFLIAA
jgi:sporulation killing factor